MKLTPNSIPDVIIFATYKSCFIWKYIESKMEPTVIIVDKTNPQKIKKFVDLLFSLSSDTCNVFKSFLVAKQIMPTFNKEHIPKIAIAFNILILLVKNNATELINIEKTETIDENNILQNITILGLIGKVFNKLKNFPSRDILLALNVFNKIENTKTEHNAISKLHSNNVNFNINEFINSAHTTTINGKDITTAK